MANKQNIRVFYDYDAFYRDHKFGGIARCFIELMKHLECDYFLSVKYSLVYYIKEVLPSTKDFSSVQFRGKARIRKFLNLVYTYWNLVFKKYDIVHLTGEKLYASWLIRKPIVVTMHDCVLEKIFNNGKRSADRLKLMQRASAVVAVSENTKRDLLEFYPEIPAEKIHVIYHGFSGFADADGENQWGKYILYVGMRQKYKNFPDLIRAIKIICQKDNNLKLICAGKPFNVSEMSLINSHGLNGKVEAVQCNDTILADLYKHSQCFVYPSHYEGFGIPILEAWYFKTPVVLSNASCFPEIAQDAAVYFDPIAPQDIADKIETVLSQSELRNSLVSKGQDRLKLFTWHNAANHYLQIYKSLMA